ncbi:sugar porter family MFS transporter [Nocardia camponoti]|uniref:Metabolite transport protein YwtG n=1 Tax=Nocardia camponoti TaxID=1616106 RepID=A0A917V3P6_9NOCA|nr:sugar porter family MFS transporter [Nocardia camponoti]GGK32437.1 putative metabolite transport protein YwtG [Nocardia camponoti]
MTDASSRPRIPGPSVAVRTKIKRFLLIVVSVAAIGGSLFGYNTGVIAGVLVFVTPQFHLSPTQVGVVTSALLVGAAMGSLAGGRLADKLGRRVTLMLAGVLFLVGAVSQGLSPNAWVMTGTRVVLGLAVGMASLVVPMYLSEIAPPHLRGRMVATNSLMLAVGQLLAYIVSALLAPSGNWRAMLLIAAVPAVALIVGMYFLPDSPRWYLSVGRRADAEEVLAKTTYPEFIQDRIHGISLAEAEDKAVKDSLWSQLRRPRVRGLMITGLGLALIQQFCGVNAVVYYAPTTLQGAGLGKNAAVTASIAIGAGAVVGVLIARPLVDRLGRRPLITIGLSIVIVVLLGMAFLERLHHSPAMGYLLLALMFVYLAAYQFGVGMPSWLLNSEIFPAPIRATAMSICTFIVWTGNFVVGLVFPPLAHAWGASTMFLIFAVISAVSLVFCYRRVPETKGVSLAQVTAYAEAAAPPMNPPRFVPDK